MLKTALILSLATGAVSLAAAVMLLCSKPRTEACVTAAAVLGGVTLFSIAFSLCLGFFMV